MRIVLPYLIITLFLFSSCQPEKTINKSLNLYVDLYIRYLEVEQQLKAQASFLEGSSITNATSKNYLGGVFFQKNKMKARELPGKVTRYTLTKKGTFSDSFRFSYKNDQGMLEEHFLGMSPIEDFFIKDEIKKSQGMTLVINGGLLKKNEQLVFLFTDQNNIAFSHIVQGPSNGIEFTLRPDQMKKLSLGKGQLYIVKSQHNSYTEGKFIVKSTLEFYSKTLDIEVLD